MVELTLPPTTKHYKLPEYEAWRHQLEDGGATLRLTTRFGLPFETDEMLRLGLDREGRCVVFGKLSERAVWLVQGLGPQARGVLQEALAGKRPLELVEGRGDQAAARSWWLVSAFSMQ